MYSRNDDIRPRRPAVTSLTHALSEIDQWVRENCFHTIKDGDGLSWHLDLDIRQEHDPSDPRGLLWVATVKLHAKVSAEMFIETGTLDRVKDERLIGLIGDGLVEVALKPSVYKSKSEDEMRQIMATVIPRLKAHLMKNSYYDIKRRLIGRFVDRAQLFA